MASGSNKYLKLILTFLLLMFTLSCAQKDVYEGVYHSQGGETQKYSASRLELMDKGRAVWRVPDDEVPFRWDITNDEIWLSSKLGGIIIGKIHGDTIEIKLPGAATMSFKKSK